MGSLLSSDSRQAQEADLPVLASAGAPTPAPNTSSNVGPSEAATGSPIGKPHDLLPENISYPSLAAFGQSNTTSQTSFMDNPTSTSISGPTAQTNSSALDEDFSFNLFGNCIYPFKWLALATPYSWLGPLSSLAMIIGCVLPYVPQYTTIYRNRDCSGFSTFVCLTLLVANIARLAFWFGHPFELPLVVQSVIMILAQLLLLELCVRVKRLNSTKQRSLFRDNPRYFWRWTNLLSYIEFLCLFSALLGLAVYFLIDCKPFVEALGYFALVTESMLGLPQVIRNYKNRSVEGMSLGMVLMWLGGDAFKTGYFIANNSPFQFWLCGLSQITIDLLILMQVCIFRRNSNMSKKKSNSPKEMITL